MTSMENRDTARRWRWGLGALVALFVAALVASMLLAVRRGAPVVDREYYEHGVHYGTSRDGGAAGGVGSWRVEVVVQGQVLRLTLADGTGRPQPGATVTFAAAVPAAPAPVLLRETAAGIYETQLPATGDSIRGTVTVVRTGDVLRRRIVVLR